MRQCVMERPTIGGVERRVAWIPEFFATLNRILRIDEGGMTENGWVVVQIGGRRSSEDQNERSQDFRRHRLGSDIGRKRGLSPRC